MAAEHAGASGKKEKKIECLEIKLNIYLMLFTTYNLTTSYIGRARQGRQGAELRIYCGDLAT